MKRATPILLVLPAFVLWTSACDTGNPVEIESAATAGSQATGPLAKPGKGGGGGGGPPATPQMEDLGGLIFADANLSLNRNQSCQTCHEPSEGFAAPAGGVTTEGSVVQGSVAGRFGDRKPPSSAYSTFAPTFSSSGNNATGGNFWDGRATGERLGNPAADQALGPFLNPLEQALPSSACVVFRVCEGAYGDQFKAVWPASCPAPSAWPAGLDAECASGSIPNLGAVAQGAVDAAYDQIGLSIAAFEASEQVSPFSSRFDAGQLTRLEEEGEKLFNSRGKCATCHDTNGAPILFTDFKFHNLGVPRDPGNPVHNYTSWSFDPGLGGFTGNASHDGKFKTPTVRNVARGDHRTFMHNGSLVSLRQVVQFYNTRDVLPECVGADLLDPASWGPDGSAGCWPPPEYPDNLDTKRMGDLGLTSGEVDAIVAFMEALNDG